MTRATCVVKTQNRPAAGDQISHSGESATVLISFRDRGPRPPPLFIDSEKEAEKEKKLTREQLLSGIMRI